MKGHYLKPNAENELPSRAICVDTETYISPNEQGEVHTLRLGCAYYIRRRGERWEEENFSFYKKEEFWAYLDRHLAKGTCLYLIGHNTAYDYAILDLDNYLSSRGFEIKLFVINQAFIIKASANAAQDNRYHELSGLHTEVVRYLVLTKERSLIFKRPRMKNCSPIA